VAAAGARAGLARCGAAPVTVVPPGGARAALAALPVRALRLDPALAAELERLGLRRIGDLYALPRTALAPRVGTAAMQRLDQALGVAPEPLSPLPPPPLRWVRRRFAEPIATQEALIAATCLLLAALCHRLGEEGLGVRRLGLTLYRVDGEVRTLDIGLALPTRSAEHVARLIDLRLERITETIDAGANDGGSCALNGLTLPLADEWLLLKSRWL